jgi:uncharacterized membrane protein YgcG
MIRLHKIVLLLSLLLAGSVNAQYPSVAEINDRILKYHSDVNVQVNGNLLVKETITVYNGDYGSIERGIFRDFPTLYKTNNGFWEERGFSVKNVYRDGTEEPYHRERLNDGVRLLIGDKDKYLSNGIFTYRLEYETTRQIIFAADRDEVYWNINGNGWIFTADTVSCTIHFPDKATIKDFRCYTGVKGSTDADCKGTQLSSNEILFVNTRRFDAYEGMTVAVGIEKGVITSPSATANFISFLKGNYIIPLLLVLTVFFVSYYFYVWHRKGRDPRRGVIYPQFSPPAGIDPVEAGYILNQRYNSQLFAAGLIDSAVKKNLNIEVSREGLLFKSNVYTFTKPADAGGSNGSGIDLNRLYGERAVKGKYNSTLRSCYMALHEDLKAKFLIRAGKTNREDAMFTLNRGYVIFATVIVIASIVATIKFLTERPSFKIGIFCGGCILIILVTHLIFKGIMSAYTKKGREIVDHLLGFKMYLAQAEQHIYNQLAPPEKTLDLFEKYLPYAVALGVENEWAAKFDSIIEQAMASGYNPSYYSFSSHAGGHFNVNDFSRGISSGLASTLSSASTPPSSSSSGGGSSGGGGGGGGGGGW